MMAVDPLEGSLTVRDFADLVKDVYASQWTGTLNVTNVGVSKSVTAQGGRLVFASSTSRDDRLGDVLLRQGKITLHQYVEAGKSVRSGKRLGSILVEKGALTPKDLVTGVVEQTREIIYSCFQWTEGQYRLKPDERGSETITLNISTPELILEGIRRVESWSRIEASVGGLEAKYVMTPQGNEILSRLSILPDKLALATALSGVQTVDQICSPSSLSHFEVCRTLWAFQIIGVVRRVGLAAPTEIEDEGLGSVLAQE
jgi:hypothetical protein